MFIVEARNRLKNNETEYPMKLAFIRHAQAGPVVEFCSKESRRSYATFHDQVEARKYAEREAESISRRWNGTIDIEFRIIPAPAKED